MSDHEAVIGAILRELDKELAEHQILYRKFHWRDDDLARHIHKRLVELCRRILKELS